MVRLRIAINGFGRIGRNVAKCLLEKYPDEMEIVAVNDLTDAATLAHLFQYDSFFGTYAKEVHATEKTLLIDGKEVQVLSEKNPLDLPWKDLKVDVVLECTGFFRTTALAQQHITAGAKKVVLSAPAKDAETPTFVFGVNADTYAGEAIVSNASCTTNCLAPLVKILHDNYGITSGMINTTHSFTQDQRLQDGPHKDLRRARTATASIIPTTTGAAKAVGKVIRELDGKLDGHSFRVPTQDVSITDFTCVVSHAPKNSEEINALFRKHAVDDMQGILDVSDLPLVSVDYKANPHSCTVDMPLTMVIGNQIKVVAWYDNEWGYSMRLAEMCLLVGKK